jgi:ribosomal peptide maturation radical SAM protein 1
MDVVFVVMPFADISRPAMGVSLLVAETKAAGYSAKITYTNIDFAQTIGSSLYQTIASAYPPELLLGEWVFADAVFGDEIPPPESYLTEIFAHKLRADAETLNQLWEARAHREAFLDRCVAQIMADRPKVVGFTTTFHQTSACLAVAQQLKARLDAPTVVFGGANCEGEMGLQMIRAFDCIDYVCSGESDLSFPELLGHCLAGEYRPVAGVLSRQRMEQPMPSKPVMQMDALPNPDFDDYFRTLDGSDLDDRLEPHLVIETSRGCWWGAKHHCTFCGLNGDTMAFRSKSPDRAYAEFRELTTRYSTNKIGIVDNILDMTYLRTLFPRLAEDGLNLDLFYEVKANLRLDQLRAMRAGGMTQIQPGIESFSDGVLKLMKKGCTGLQNIQLLRWCREVGISVAWNVLGGFPDEDPEEYWTAGTLMPKLTHLDAPCSCARIRLDRFSPFHSRAEEYGFHKMRPARAYFYVFPLGRQELSRLAYFFDYDYADGRQPDSYMAPVHRAAGEWVAAHRGEEDPPRLDAHWSDAGLRLEDTRAVAPESEVTLTGRAAEIYLLCDNSARVERIANKTGAAAEEVQAILDDLVERGLMVVDKGRYLSLAVFRSRPPEPPSIEVQNAQEAPHRKQLLDLD